MAKKKLFFKRVDSLFESLPITVESLNSSFMVAWGDKQSSSSVSVYISIDKVHWSFFWSETGVGSVFSVFTGIPKGTFLKFVSSKEPEYGDFLDPDGTESNSIVVSGSITPKVSGVSLVFTHSEYGDFPAVISSDGKYSLELPAGSYTYVCSAPNYQNATGSVDATKTLNISLKTANITVSGKVTPASAKLTFTKKSGGDPISANINSESGAYSQVLPRDTYTYNATNDGYTPKTGEVSETSTLDISLVAAGS